MIRMSLDRLTQEEAVDILHVIFYWMNEIAETCSLCNKPNDQMLMLSCIHDPCINCAASAYAEQIFIKGQSK